MAIIDPEGLFGGDRLAACSDKAQLLWPRLFLAANSCARLELSYSSIVSKIFASFKKPPTTTELWAIFEEYDANCLAILYEADGSWWCQFITSEKFLPKYKRTRDTLTPAPSADAMEVFHFAYMEWKKTNVIGSNTFRNVRKVSDGKGREGVGVGIGVGEESTFAQSSNELHADAPQPIGALPCIGPEKSWPLFQAKVDEWQETYPGVDVKAELRKARQWLIDNPTKRKTHKGMTKFLNAWLAKGQDRGGIGNGTGGQHHQGAVGRVKRTGAAWDAALAKRIGDAPGDDASADVGGDASPGVRRGDDGSVSAGVRGTGGGVQREEPRDGPAVVSKSAEVLSPSQRSPRGS